MKCFHFVMQVEVIKIQIWFKFKLICKLRKGLNIKKCFLSSNQPWAISSFSPEPAQLDQLSTFLHEAQTGMLPFISFPAAQPTCRPFSSRGLAPSPWPRPNIPTRPVLPTVHVAHELAQHTCLPPHGADWRNRAEFIPNRKPKQILTKTSNQNRTEDGIGYVSLLRTIWKWDQYIWVRLGRDFMEKIKPNRFKFLPPSRFIAAGWALEKRGIIDEGWSKPLTALGRPRRSRPPW
jgi:hypothetical protein